MKKLLSLLLILSALAILAACADGAADKGSEAPVSGTPSSPAISVEKEEPSEAQSDAEASSDESGSERMYDYPPIVMVNGVLYQDTGKESTVDGRCGNMDGEITSTVDGSELPTEDDQSNFGCIGTGYQYGPDEDTIELYLNGVWTVFTRTEQ